MKAVKVGKIAAAILMCATITACGLVESKNPWPDPVALSNAIESAYTGAKFDDLVQRYGVPSQSMGSPSGGLMYVWHQTHLQSFSGMPPALYSCDLDATVDGSGRVTRAWLNGQAGACWKFR